MNEAEAINAVVDKISDKLSIVADKIEPLAIETVDQYQLGHTVYTSVGILLLIVGCVLFILGCRKWIATAKLSKKEVRTFHDAETLVICLLFIPGVINLVAGLVTATLHFARAVAPLPHILGL